MEYDVFLSKNTKDLGEAKKIVAVLKSYGLKVFESSEELNKMGNADYASSIDKALDASRHMIVLCSGNEHGTGEGTDSLWVYYEWSSFRNEICSKRKGGNIVVVLTGRVNHASIAYGLRKYEAFSIDDIDGEKFKNYFVSPSMQISQNETKASEAISDSRRAANIKAFDFGLHFSMNMFAKQCGEEQLYDLNEDWENFNDIPAAAVLTTDPNPDVIADLLQKAYGKDVARYFSFGQRTGLLSIIILFLKKGANISNEQKNLFFEPFMKEGRQLFIPDKVLKTCIDLVSDTSSDQQIINCHKIVRHAILTSKTVKCKLCSSENAEGNSICTNCFSPL